MANPEHQTILKQGVEVWNKWREENPDIEPDFYKVALQNAKLSGANLSCAILVKANFSGADLNGANLRKANLSMANLSNAKISRADFRKESLSRQSPIFSNLRDNNLDVADLSDAVLSGANLSGANLRKAKLIRANLLEADLSDADLSEAVLGSANLRRAKLIRAKLFDAKLSRADLSKAILREAKLHEANLHEANLEGAILVEANLERADLCRSKLYRADLSNAIAKSANFQGAQLAKTVFTNANLEGCYLYGSSAWELELEGANQTNLIITEKGKPVISVDNLEVAQFIYLLLNNEKIRHVIDTITSKVVLILGRFAKPRKAVLDAIRNELRQHDYVPVLFDFNKPISRDIHETVGTLARMARFVIADITNPRSIPQELVSIVEQLPSLPVQPLLKHGSKPWGMYGHIKRYPWVLEIHKYRNLKDLLGSIRDRVIAPAEKKWLELNEKG